jgi:hypothetical protein
VTTGAQVLVGAAPAAAEVCDNVAGPTASVTITICLQSPDANATLTGFSEVRATATVNPPGAVIIDRLNFWWGTGTSPAYLMADHDAPYALELDTTRLPNGPGVLRSRVVLSTGFTTTRPSYNVVISNPPPPPPDGETFTPRLGEPGPDGRVRMAVVGDGVDGSPESHAVADVIDAADPDVFAYLGDVYDRGTTHEFHNWYDLDNDGFGRFLDITNPTIGNHEYMESATAAPYFEFWNEIPNYYSYDIGGWHVVVINSNTEFGQLGVNSAQYAWLAADLAANQSRCTMMYAHHARWTAVDGVSRTGLQPMWELLSDTGADLILGGHAHTYERWTPLDRSGLVPRTEGITQFVVGTGGRPILNAKHPEPRIETEVTTPGALILDLGPSDANFTFTAADGSYSDSGTIPCRTPPSVTRTDSSVLPGDDGWHRGDVTATWEAADPESPVTTVGCEPLSVTADQPKTTYTCTATSGGGVTVDKVEIGRDATPPLVTASIDPTAPDGTNDWYVTQPTVTFTCDDVTSGVKTCPDQVPPAEGTSSVTRTGQDVAGNTADATYGPVKVDLTNPTVTCDDRVTYLLHQTGTLVGAAVTDTPSGPVRAREVLAVDTGTVGDQTATVTGTDLAGRTGSDVCDYRVVYGFSGFQPPVNGSAGAVNVVKAGKVVPLKWLLADAAGVPVTTLGSVRVSTVSHSCTTTAGGVQDPVEETAPGGSGLQNLGDGSYQYNWRTPTSYAGSCRTVRLDLGDDLPRPVEFRFTA